MTAVLTPAEVRAMVAALPFSKQLQAAEYAEQSGMLTVAPKPAPAPAVPETTLWEFATQRPWQIDRHGFDWAHHRYLIPLYEAFRLDPVKTDGLTMTLVKGAQIGASVWAMLGLIFLSTKFPASKAGYFLPDQPMSQLFSADRFKPMLQSNPTIGGLLGNEGDGTNNMRLRTVGTSSIFFSYMGGSTSTESLPLLGIYFDEVRRMAMTDIGLAEQRISHSPYPVNIKLSTAGLPNTDIDYYYQRSNQQEWHTRCRCADGIVLADAWPDCIGVRGDEIFYRCPRCDQRITDPQEGGYLRHGSAQAQPGWRIPQTLSHAPLHRPPALWQRYINPKEDRGEFYRSCLGRPYVDPESQMVQEEDLIACENTDLQWQSTGTNCVIGVDCMGGYAWVVVKMLAPNDKHRLLHIECIEGDDPLGARMDQLMRDFDVSCAVVDMLPNWNDGMRLAKRWTPRVFLATYQRHDAMIAWQDRIRPLRQKPNDPDIRLSFRYRVTMNRYKVLEWSLRRFQRRDNEMPHRRGLVQTLPDEHGIRRPMFVCEEFYWVHMQRMVSQKKIKHEETGESEMIMINLGMDPHLVHANAYADVALQRTRGGRVAII
jgi:hypothetical protein